MTKKRIDQWTEPEDQFLIHTVLRYVREGRTQLQAFEDIGEKLDRSPGGVNFRWNGILRKYHEEELLFAKREKWARKKARMVAHRVR
jgi:prespore-specific regulator